MVGGPPEAPLPSIWLHSRASGLDSSRLPLKNHITSVHQCTSTAAAAGQPLGRRGRYGLKAGTHRRCQCRRLPLGAAVGACCAPLYVRAAGGAYRDGQSVWPEPKRRPRRRRLPQHGAFGGSGGCVAWSLDAAARCPASASLPSVLQEGLCRCVRGEGWRLALEGMGRKAIYAGCASTSPAPISRLELRLASRLSWHLVCSVLGCRQ